MGVQINGSEGNVIATKGTYSGNVTIGGTLTYEDVTNIDSVGLVTARSGIEIGARPGVGASISVDGNAIFSGITTIGGASEFGGNMQMTGSNPEFEMNAGGPRFRVPSANTLSIFTSGGLGSTSNERLRIDSSGKFGIGMSADQITALKGKLDIDASGIDAAGDTDDPNDYAIVIRNPSSTNSGNGIAFTNDSGAAVGGAIIHIDKGTNNIGDLAFLTSASSNTPVERLRITSGGKILIGDGTAENTIGLNANVQTFGTDASTSSVAIRRGSNDAQAAFLVMSKSRNASVGSRTILQNGDEVGNIFFAADDGTDLVSNTAAIKSQVDGAPGANDTPGNLTFWTTPDGSNTSTQKVTISNAGLMTVTKQYYLVADLSADIGSYNATGSGPIIFNRIAEEYKDASLASCFNTSTGLFTTPVTGLYFLEAAAYSTNATFGQSWWVVAGARKSFTDEVLTGGAAFIHNHTMLRLTAGETVGFLAYMSSGSNVNVKANANHTYMKIALMH